MRKKAVQDSLRPALLVLMMTAVSGCGQPVRPETARWFSKPTGIITATSDEAETAQAFMRGRSPSRGPGAASHRVPSEHSQDYSEYAHAIERMSAGFQLPELRHPRLDRQIVWYQRNSNTLRNSLNRADPFIAWILDQLESNSMPAELALIPVIESGYQPSALSPSHAAGLWQFMPATGNRFGLEQNRWYDGRQDVVASTQAALEYFAYLRDEFEGDWLLALAAYNAGEGTVARAVQRNRSRGLPTDILSLDLPVHTQDYVLKLLALRDIVLTPGHYGIKLPELTPTTQIALIETSAKMDLGSAASMAGLTVADVQRLNPGLRSSSTPPQGPHRLVVPLTAANRFAAHLTARAADMSVAEESQPDRSTPAIAAATANSANVHHVRPGETLWSLARRYGIRVEQLASLNAIPPDATLRAGQTLRLTRTGERQVADAKNAPKERQTTQYTVRRGDSLIQISRRYRVAIDDLRKWNGLRHDQYLQPGQKLTLYLDTSMRADGGS